MICIQKIFGFHGIIVKISRKVDMSHLWRRTDGRTDRKWKIEQCSVGPETAKVILQDMSSKENYILHCIDRKAHSKSAIQKPQSAFCKTKTLMHSMHTHSGMQKSWCTIWNSNIAKGTTDPRVEFISQDHSLQFTNLEHITISESRLSINFKIWTKNQHIN